MVISGKHCWQSMVCDSREFNDYQLVNTFTTEDVQRELLSTLTGRVGFSGAFLVSLHTETSNNLTTTGRDSSFPLVTLSRSPLHIDGDRNHNGANCRNRRYAIFLDLDLGFHAVDSVTRFFTRHLAPLPCERNCSLGSCFVLVVLLRVFCGAWRHLPTASRSLTALVYRGC